MGGGQGNLQQMTSKIPLLNTITTNAKANMQKTLGKLAPPGSLLGKILGLNGDRPSWVTDTGPSSTPTTNVSAPLVGNTTLLGSNDSPVKRLGLGG